MTYKFTESVVEEATLSWLAGLGYKVVIGSRTVAALRDLLLPKLMSGEIRVDTMDGVDEGKK